MESTTTNQFLTFVLDDDYFAINISNIKEVLDYSAPTRIPRSPSFLLGVINLRGNMVPVVDLRIILGMPPRSTSADTCFIIAEIPTESENMLLGAMADSVVKVGEIPDSVIKPAPNVGTKLNIVYLKGIGKIDDRFVMILDLDKVLSFKELGIVEELTESMTPMLLDMGTEENAEETSV